MLAAPTTTLTSQDPVHTQRLAEPDALDGFDRSGHGIAQRRRAAIIGTGSAWRNVAQRELEVTANPDGVGEESAKKLERVANTLNSMPFEQSMEISLKTESGEKGAPPLRSKLAGEDEATTTIYLQTNFVESSTFEQILQSCMNTLGNVIFKNKADPTETAKLQKETVLAECDQIVQSHEDQIKNPAILDPTKPAKPQGFPTSQLLAKLCDYLVQQAYEKIVTDRTESVESTLKRTTDLSVEMSSLFSRMILNEGRSHGWIRRLPVREFSPASVRASLVRFLSQRQGSGSSSTKS